MVNQTDPEFDPFVEAQDERRRSLVNRITTERNTAFDGQKIADYLLGLVPHPEYDAQPHTGKAHAPGADSSTAAAVPDPSAKWRMFSEIVSRCAYDTAGNAYGLNKYGKRYNGFDSIFQALIDKQKEETRGLKQDETLKKQESLYRKVLNCIPLYQKGVVQTPHPTEMLNHDAIRAEIDLHHAIEEIFTRTNGANPSGKDKVELEERLKALYTAIEPIPEGMKIKDEIKRSIEFSELAFNAVPEMMHGVLDPAIRQGLRNTQPLTFDELRHFGRLIEPGTWSPGDRDSKPDMTTKMLQYGIERNQAIMSLHYAVKIAEIEKEANHLLGVMQQEARKPITANVQSLRKSYPDLGVAEFGVKVAQVQQDLVKNQQEKIKNQEEVVDKLDKLLHHIVGSLPANQRPTHVPTARTLNHKPGDNGDNESLGDRFLVSYCQRADGDLKDHVHIAERIYNATTRHTAQKKFAANEIIQETEAIRKMQLKGAEFKRPHLVKEDSGYREERHIITPLDVLVAQMHCFGNYALRPQIRENAEMHENVMEELRPLLHLTGADRKQRAEELLDILCNPTRKAEAKTVRDAVQRKMAEEAPAGDARGTNVYETLGGMRLAAEHPDAIPRYLIAECRSSTDILETFALLKLVETDVSRATGKSVEIVPLVEYREHMAIIGEMMDDAYKNQHFHDHHQAIGRNNTQAFVIDGPIKKTNEETITVAEARRSWLSETPSQSLTAVANRAKIERTIAANKEEEIRIPKISVADVKRQYGRTVLPGDDKHFLIHPDSKLGHHQTVAEVKKTYGLPVPMDSRGNILWEQVSEHDKKLIDHTKMVMFAGSDIMKSAGPAGAAFTRHQIEDLRSRMLDQDPPVLLIDYTGLGGGLHRSQPAATTFETTQGRSMRQTAASIAQKAVITMARFVRRTLGLGDDNLPAKESDRRKLAQINLGNMAGFPVHPGEWAKPGGTGERANACMDQYKQLYDSPEFACMMAFSADKFVKLTSYAARPPGRNRASGDSSDYPPIVDVKELRAIGYGAALNISGSCASLFYGVGDFLNLKGKEDIAAVEDLYKRDPKAQDVINRATFGVAMADMDTAWKYLGMKREVKGGKVQLTDLLDNGKTASVDELASRDHASVKGLLTQYDQRVAAGNKDDHHKNTMEWLQMGWVEGADSQDEGIKKRAAAEKFSHKRALAIHALAKIDQEYQKVSDVLLKLHGRMASQEPKAGQMQTHEQILELLPYALQSQLRSMRAGIEPVRGDLANQFLASWRDREKPHPLHKEVKEVRKDDKEFYNDIYYRMGALQEVFENVPRAFTRPYWGIAAETQHALAV
jgi:phosphoenolpyruvate carboxylase